MSLTAELSISKARNPDVDPIDQNRPRRLLFIIEALTVGGAERMVVDLANEFIARGEQVNVVCLSSLGELSDSLHPDVGLHVLHKRRGIDFKVCNRLRALVAQVQPDVVNSHLWTANLWTRLALYRSNIPVVATEHNRDVWKRSHNKLIDRLLSRSTAMLIAVSEDTANFYKNDVGIDSRLVRVVNNGVDTQRYASGDGKRLHRLLSDADQLLIGTVGRLTVQKNHPRLVQAAAILKEKGISFQVVIAGDGPERESTQACIEKLGVADCVTLLGERSDIADLLAALDIFVLSSDREGHPLSALEAQSAGTPVVLTDAGGSADAISRSGQQVGGILVDKTPYALASTLEELSADRPRLRSMGEFACKYAAQHFDKQTMIDCYSESFDTVINT